MSGCLIIAKKINNVTESVSYILPDIDISFEISLVNDLHHINKKFSYIVLVDCTLNEKEMEKLLIKDGSIIVIGQDLSIIETNFRINYIKTNLVEDENKYTLGEKEFLFKKNIYNILNKQVIYLLSEEAEYLNRAIIDVSSCKPKFTDGIFEFSSISESYMWLTKKLQNGNKFKIIEYYMEKIYDDSNKEIQYLIDRLKAIENGKRIVQVFLCDNEEIKSLRKSLFFKILLENKNKGNVLYIANKQKVKEYLKDKYDDILYGIIIYEDCVYRDYLDNEYTLGYVDCKQDTIKKYDEIFDDIINNVAIKLESEGDIDELF